MNPLTQLKRLQGTDGIRGPIARANQFQGIHPLEVWIHHGFLTEEFFELYAFSFSKNLLDSGWAKKGDSLVIGWDTRDTEGIFNAAAKPFENDVATFNPVNEPGPIDMAM